MTYTITNRSELRSRLELVSGLLPNRHEVEQFRPRLRMPKPHPSHQRISAKRQASTKQQG